MKNLGRILFLLMSGSAAQAQDAPSLLGGPPLGPLHLQRTPRDAPRPTFADEHFLDLLHDPTARLQEGVAPDAVRVALPDGTALLALREGTWVDDDGTVAWAGRPTDDAAGAVILVRRGTMVLGAIDGRESAWRLEGSTRRGVWLSRTDGAVEPDDPSPFAATLPWAVGAMEPVDPGPPVTLDVGVLIAPDHLEMLAGRAGHLDEEELRDLGHTWAHLATVQTALALTRSDRAARLRTHVAFASEPVDRGRPCGIAQALSAREGWGAQVSMAWAERVEADVLFYVFQRDGTTELGCVPDVHEGGAPTPEQAVAALSGVSFGRPRAWTAAHEFVHLLGGRHVPTMPRHVAAAAPAEPWAEPPDDGGFRRRVALMQARGRRGLALEPEAGARPAPPGPEGPVDRLNPFILRVAEARLAEPVQLALLRGPAPGPYRPAPGEPRLLACRDADPSDVDGVVAPAFAAAPCGDACRLVDGALTCGDLPTPDRRILRATGTFTDGDVVVAGLIGPEPVCCLAKGAPDALRLVGGPGDDTLLTQTRGWRLPSSVRQRLEGGPGDDLLAAGSRGPGVVAGGPGRDDLHCADRCWATLRPGPDGEGDLVYDHSGWIDRLVRERERGWFDLFVALEHKKNRQGR